MTAILALGLTGCGSGDDTTLAPHEYRVVKVGDVVQELQVQGTITAGETRSVNTALTGPVNTLNIAVGDRVEADQIIATIDVSEQERALRDQQAQQADAVVGAVNGIEQAQQAYDQYQEGLNEGLNPELNGAESALRTATTAYDNALRSFEEKKSQVNAGRDERLVSQEQAVDAARKQVFSASLNVARAGVGSVAAETRGAEQNLDLAADLATLSALRRELADAAGDQEKTAEISAKIDALQASIKARQRSDSIIPEQEINAHLGTVESVANLADSVQSLNRQQQAYDAALRSVNSELAQSQRDVAAAFEQKKDAAVALETARLNTRHQLQNLTSGIEQARRSAQAARSGSNRTAESLNADIASSTVRAPFAGLVIAVPAEVGKPAAGSIATIADDTGLTVTAQIPEIDVAKLSPGAKAEFTTPATGSSTYKGTVSSVSPVASGVASASAATGDTAAGGPTKDTKPTFAVVIRVDGPTDGLRIGGSAKIHITFAEETDTISVSRDAAYDRDDGTKAVLVVTEDGTVEERSVTLGTADDFTVAVSGGDLKEGDKVINQGSTHRYLIGQKVKLDTTEDGDDGR
ncbi:HlyD family efflux transporter periplasmic adaptor subunit [Corynebacterium sp. CCM 9185]|uniref:HlyD family efflux transporter periplasmic adaptor subunit n=1 Tax=Corynebacterium marambiense TaxID=2765364 RepID=A0ABS0VXR5_9CORY|nr:HlyD family efflux transporter periplasmic adaptor subunit [Corynebacterium marambiense]MCK7664396.1 HlyD family efflux transporter periplasmic adaptor subunit [Corynebacterium marambiense]